MKREDENLNIDVHRPFNKDVEILHTIDEESLESDVYFPEKIILNQYVARGQEPKRQIYVKENEESKE